jgi:photosystem II stability/assembly factor-like uncharacterized protein
MKKLSIFCLFVFVFACEGYTQSGINWEWLHASPHGSTLRNVQRVAPSTWYFVGVNGLFQKTTDDGQTWDIHYTAGRYLPESNTYSTGFDLHFFDVNNGIVVGGNGTIIKTADAGNTWQEVTTNPTPSHINLLSVQFVDNLFGFASGNLGTLLKTTDGGNTWSLIPLSFTSTVFDVWSPDGNLIIVPTTAGNVHRSTDGGATWSVINLGSFFNVTKLAGSVNDLYLTGSSDNVRRSTDGGLTWSSVANGIPLGTGFNDIDVKNGVIYLTGPSTYFCKSTNQGVTWDTVGLDFPGNSFPATNHSMDVSPGGDSLFIASTFGLVYSKLGDSAPVVTYNKRTINSSARDIYVSPDRRFIITVNLFSTNVQKNINRSTDGGATWIADQIVPSSIDNIFSLDMIDTLTGFAVGALGFLYKTSDGGNSWNQVTTTGLPANNSLYSVEFKSQTTGWILAISQWTAQESVFKTTDGGSTWFHQPLGVQGSEPPALSSHMLDSLKGWISCVGGIFNTTDGGSTWQKDSLAVAYTGNINAIRMLNTTTGLAATSNGRVYRTTNGGTLWDTVSVPAGLPALYSIEQLNETTVAIFGDNGVYLYSTDSGSIWAKQNTGGTGGLCSFHRYDPVTQTTILYTAGIMGNVMKTSLSVLPVELASFSASISDRDVVLEWSTATELNNRGFEIQRKRDENKWETLSFVNGKGTSTKISEYRYVDKDLFGGTYSYRIKQIDFDGTIWYSHSVEIEIGVPLTFGLSQNFPNPFNPTTVIRYELPVSGMVSLKVYNAMGEEVTTLVNSTKEAGSHSITFDASKLASGIYIYKLKSGNFSSVKKMSLIK